MSPLTPPAGEPVREARPQEIVLDARHKAWHAHVDGVVADCSRRRIQPYDDELFFAGYDAALARTQNAQPVAGDAIRQAVETIANRCTGLSLAEWDPIANTLLAAAQQIDATPIPADGEAEIAGLRAEVERLKREADGEFVQAACRVMQGWEGFEPRDYAEDGITADDFYAFFREDMTSAWKAAEAAEARAAKSEERVRELEGDVARKDEALRPFGLMADGYDQSCLPEIKPAPAGQDQVAFHKGFEIVVGHLRAARAALARSDKPARDGDE